MDVGIYTLAELTPDPRPGRPVSPAAGRPVTRARVTRPAVPRTGGQLPANEQDAGSVRGVRQSESLSSLVHPSSLRITPGCSSCLRAAVLDYSPTDQFRCRRSR